MKLILGLLLFSQMLTSGQLFSMPEVQWQHAYPNPTANGLSAVTWGPPGFVAAGDFGEILFSADANDWKRITVREAGSSWFKAACYGDGKYLLVSDREILLSTNGQDWTVVHADTNGLYACAGGAGAFVATSIGQTLLVSTNAIEWQERATPAAFTKLTFGNGVWVALTVSSEIYGSSNLENWALVHPNSPSGWGPVLSSIAFGNHQFIAGGAFRPDEPNGASYGSVVLTSSNGVHWAAVNGLNSVGEVRGLAFGGGRFVAALKNHLLHSVDGTVWEALSGPDAGGDFNGIAASADGHFVVVGEKGAMLKSDNAATWEIISKDRRVDIHSIAWAKQRFVAVGGSPYYLGGPTGSAAVLSSTNGVHWQAALTHLENQLSGVAYGHQVWVVTGDDGQIFTSRNGVDWADYSLPPTTHDLRQVVFGGGRFVAFADSRDLVYRSVNGKRWTAVQAPFASEIAKARFLNRRFVGVGGDQDGFIFTSGNGVKWKKTTLSGVGWFGGVAFGNRRFVAGGRSVSAVSRDGVKWTTYPTPRIVYDLQYVDDWFVGVGPDGMVFSRDGMTWEVSDEPHPFGTMGLFSYGGETFVGSYGATLYRGVLEVPPTVTPKSD